MQAAKDTFLKTLAARLAVVNPARTVTTEGVTRPAVVAVENEIPMADATARETFLLRWAGAGTAKSAAGLMYVDCQVSYGSRGSEALLRTDRGRVLTAMDGELLQICGLRQAEKMNYTGETPQSLESQIFWSYPVLDRPEIVDGVLQRTATLRVFYFPEAA